MVGCGLLTIKATIVGNHQHYYIEGFMEIFRIILYVSYPKALIIPRFIIPMFINETICLIFYIII